MLNKDTYRKTMKRLKMIGINTRDHKAVVRELAEEIDYYRDKIQTIEQAMDMKIMYVCDQRKCKSCIPDDEFCGHTDDIFHAKNFRLFGNTFVEDSPLSNKK